MNINEQLYQFANQSSSFDNPFNDANSSDTISPVQLKAEIDQSEEQHREYKKKKKKKDKFSKVIEKGDKLIENLSDDEMVTDFDDYLESYVLDDDDSNIKNNLLSLGRKYARDNRVSGESSEISKAFSGSEKMMSIMLEEIKKDKEEIQKDISAMRISRSRNYKNLSELINTKGQLHSTTLNIIKEINNMKKTQFDLQSKAEKKKTEDNDSSASSNRAIQTLFGLSRRDMMSSIGGYEGVSGASEEGFEDDTSSYDVDEDEIIQRKYFSNDAPETDGDKFLKYEGLGVKYILLIDYDNDTKEIIAEDKDGNMIPDYPMPKDIDNLSFDISSNGTATDNFNRNYEVREL